MSTCSAAAVVQDPRRSAVIIVDDEADARRYVGAVVRKMGLNGIEASSAREVKRIAAEHKNAVVVLDVALGEEDAGDVLEALAAERFAGPIILVSGQERTLLDWAHGLGAHMNLNMAARLRKPFTPDELRDNIRAAAPAPREAAL
jgi:DNA-binding NtrC family response regulator